MQGLDLGDLKSLVVEPALTAIGLLSSSALNLVTGIAPVETDARRLKQVDGPALGLWQMEPATEQSLWTNTLAYRPDLRAKIQSLLRPGATTSQLIDNLQYAAAMARLRIYISPAPLPDAKSAAALCSMWKSVYNTAGGAGAVTADRISMFQAAIEA